MIWDKQRENFEHDFYSLRAEKGLKEVLHTRNLVLFLSAEKCSLLVLKFTRELNSLKRRCKIHTIANVSFFSSFKIISTNLIAKGMV